MAFWMPPSSASSEVFCPSRHVRFPRGQPASSSSTVRACVLSVQPIQYDLVRCLPRPYNEARHPEPRLVCCCCCGSCSISLAVSFWADVKTLPEGLCKEQSNHHFEFTVSRLVAIMTSNKTNAMDVKDVSRTSSNEDSTVRTYGIKDHWKCLAACTMVSMCPFQYGTSRQQILHRDVPPALTWKLTRLLPDVRP